MYEPLLAFKLRIERDFDLTFLYRTRVEGTLENNAWGRIHKAT